MNGESNMAKPLPIVDTGLAERMMAAARQHPLWGFELAVLDFADKVDAELERRRMTRAELAERAGVKPSYISRVLNNPENITLQTLFRLANALEMDVEIDLKARHQEPARKPRMRKVQKAPKAVAQAR
jgi:plasmid maintenance system antidote protein VapI